MTGAASRGWPASRRKASEARSGTGDIRTEPVAESLTTCGDRSSKTSGRAASRVAISRGERARSQSRQPLRSNSSVWRALHSIMSARAACSNRGGHCLLLAAPHQGQDLAAEADHLVELRPAVEDELADADARELQNGIGHLPCRS